MGGPTPYGQSQNRWIFLSPTRCKGGGHSFCLIHTKFSALNILNAQNCWVIFQKLGLKTSLRHEPSNFNRSRDKSDLLKVIYISRVLNYLFKVPHALWHPRGLLLLLGTPYIKLHEGIWPLRWSGRRGSKFIECTVLAVQTYDKTKKSANIFMFYQNGHNLVYFSFPASYNHLNRQESSHAQTQEVA